MSMKVFLSLKEKADIRTTEQGNRVFFPPAYEDLQTMNY